MKCLKLLVFLKLLLFIYSYEIKDDSKFYFCSSRIFVSDNRISVSEINLMCNRIFSDNRIIINIQRDLIVNSMGSELDNYYTRDSEEFFIKQCTRLNTSICNYGFLISIYTLGRKVRVTAGSVSKNQISLEKRNHIILSIKNLLSQERYAEGVVKAVDLIQSYSYNSPGNNLPYNGNNYNPNPSYIPPNNNQKSSSSGFWLFFLFIICPMCLCLVYFMYKRSEVSESFHTKTPDYVHDHINKLDILLNDIRSNTPQMLTINKCLICMNQINMIQNSQNFNHFSTTNNDYNSYNNMQSNLVNQDTNHTRFACGHVYHNLCLNNCQLTACIMCPGNVQASMITPNNHDSQIIVESNIKNLIKNLHLIYGRDTLQDYAKTYPSEFSTYNSNLALGLVGVWGITSVATTAIMMSEMNNMNHHYDNYNHHSGYNDVSYNPQISNNYPSHNELDTAEGDF
jgi:hypothetical protein